MNENTNNKRKDIIKNILIVFLIILLILTFFSNTIMNYSLPEISTESSMSGTLTEKLTVSGMIESNQSYEVKTDGNKTIDVINVKTGQYVEKGTVLFEINTEENAELTEAETTLKSLEKEYQKMLLTVPNDYASENLAIKNAREDLNTLIAKRDEVLASQSINDARKNEYNQAKNELSSVTSQLVDLESYISALDSDDVSSVGLEYTQYLVGYYNEYVSAQNDFQEVDSELSELLMSSEKDESAIAVLQVKYDEKKLYLEQCKGVYETEKANIRASLSESIAYLEGESSRLNSIIVSYEADMSSSESLTVESLDAEITAKQRELESLLIALENTKKQDNIETQSNNIDVQSKLDEVNKQKEKVEKLKSENGEKSIKAEYSGVVSQILVKVGETTVPDNPVATLIFDSVEGKFTYNDGTVKTLTGGRGAMSVRQWHQYPNMLPRELYCDDELTGEKFETL